MFGFGWSWSCLGPPAELAYHLSDHNDYSRDGCMTQAHIPKLCMELLEMLWRCKRLGCEARAASNPLPTTRVQHDPAKEAWNWVPIALWEALDPAVIRNLPGIFSCTFSCLSLGSIRNWQDSSASDLIEMWSLDAWHGHEGEWQEEKSVNKMCVIKPVGTSRLIFQGISGNQCETLASTYPTGGPKELGCGCTESCVSLV